MNYQYLKCKKIELVSKTDIEDIDFDNSVTLSRIKEKNFSQIVMETLMKKQLEDQPIPEVWDSNDVINLCDRVQEIFKKEPNILQRINNINN